MASFRDTIIRGDLHVLQTPYVGSPGSGYKIYHEGYAPKPSDVGALEVTIGTNKPTSGHWYEEVGGYSNIKRVKIKPGSGLNDPNYNKIIHPETDATMVILSSGKNLQQVLDSAGISSETNNIVETLLATIYNLENELEAERIRCPHPIGTILKFKEGISPNELWKETSWENIGQEWERKK